MVVSVGADRSRKRQANRSLLTRRNSTSATGQFNSVRHDGVLRAFQSKPEFLHLAILDVHPNIEWFETQPDTIELPGGRWYTADVFATFRRGRRAVYREVKKRAALETDPDLEGRYLDIVAACEERGADFEIVLEGYWLEPVRWSITSLLRHSVRRASRIEKDIVRMALEDGAMSLAEIMRATSLSHAGRSAALALAADGVATFRRDRAVTLDTLVRLV
jgi:hypothetical protein